MALLKFTDGSVLAFLKFTDGSVLALLKSTDGSVLALLRLPLIFSCKISTVGEFWCTMAIMKEKQQNFLFEIECLLSTKEGRNCTLAENVSVFHTNLPRSLEQMGVGHATIPSQILDEHTIHTKHNTTPPLLNDTQCHFPANPLLAPLSFILKAISKKN